MGVMELCWVLPSTGDSEYVGTWMPEREPDLELLTAVARVADEAGYHALLVTVGAVNNHFGPAAPYVDPFVAAAAVVPATERIRFLVALRTGTMTPPTAARACATLDVLSGGRFMLNAVSGGRTLTMYGESDDHGDRYARTDEQLTILRGLWSEERFSFSGRFYTTQDAILHPKPVQPAPPIYFAGQSEPARTVGARHADTMLLPGTTPDRAAEYVADMRARAEAAGRSIRVGTHFYVITRETRAAAVDAADRLLSRIDPRLERPAAGDLPAFVEPGLYTGLRRLWGDASLALVGSYDEVARAIERFLAAGLETFILSSFPMVEEAERFAERVVPLIDSARR